MDLSKDFLKPFYLTDNKKLSRQNGHILRKWALEAHKLDPSRPIKFYYDLFHEKLKNKFMKDIWVKKVFGDEPIE